VIGLIKLRITFPDQPRPFRTWGYPITPLIFLAVTLFMLVHLVTARPLQSLAGLLLMLVGLVLYRLVTARERRKVRMAPPPR